MINRIGQKKQEWAIPAVLLVMTAVSALFILFSYSSGIMEYDCYDYTEGIPLAEASIRAGALFDPEYMYYYLIPLGPNVWMAPFVILFGYSMIANRLGMLVYYVLLMAAVWYLSGGLFEQKKDRLLFSAFLNLFVYTYVGDNLLHHLIGYGIGFVCLLVQLACVMAVGNGRASVREYVLLVLAGIWAAVNGEVTSALSCIPVILAVLYCGYRNRNLKKYAGVLVILAAVTAAGMGVYKYIDTHVVSRHMYDTRFLLDTAENTGAKIFAQLPGDYLKLFFYDPAGESVFSPEGILMLVRLVFALLIPAVPFLAMRAEKNNGIRHQTNEAEEIFLYAHLLVLAVCFGEYLLVETTVLRYLFNGVMSLFCLGAWFLVRLPENLRIRPVAVMLAFTVLMTGKTIFVTYPYGKAQEQKFAEASALLDEHDLTIGYSFTMHMEPMELYVNGRQRVNCITYKVSEERWFVNNDRVYRYELYRPEGIRQFYVLAENGGARDELQTRRGEELLTQCKKKIRNETFTLYIFDIEQWDDVFLAGEHTND